MKVLKIKEKGTLLTCSITILCIRVASLPTILRIFRIKTHHRKKSFIQQVWNIFIISITYQIHQYRVIVLLATTDIIYMSKRNHRSNNSILLVCSINISWCDLLKKKAYICLSMLLNGTSMVYTEWARLATDRDQTGVTVSMNIQKQMSLDCNNSRSAATRVLINNVMIFALLTSSLGW